MTADQTCALPGCNKPPFPSPGRSTPHLACSNLHHQLLMAGRFNPTLPHPHHQILDRNSDGLCAFPSCHNPPQPEFPWCSQSHYLRWLNNFTDSLHPDQICKLFPACSRHVFVDNNGSPSRFCGWRHCQEYVVLSAMQRSRQQLTQQLSVSSPRPFTESKRGHLPSVESLVHCLREYAYSAKAPKMVKVDLDFFYKHPWDVSTVAEGQASLLLVRCKQSNGKRVMVTKDNYHWKQQGPPSSKGDFTQKYFTYRRLKGKKNDVTEHGDGCIYYMDEYTVEDVKFFSLVKVRKAIDGPVRNRKRRPAADGKQSRADVTNIDEMFADSFFQTLSTLADCSYDFDQIFSSSSDVEDFWATN